MLSMENRFALTNQSACLPEFLNAFRKMFDARHTAITSPRAKCVLKQRCSAAYLFAYLPLSYQLKPLTFIYLCILEALIAREGAKRQAMQHSTSFVCQSLQSIPKSSATLAILYSDSQRC